jgi:hypothetical protein
MMPAVDHPPMMPMPLHQDEAVETDDNDQQRQEVAVIWTCTPARTNCRSSFRRSRAYLRIGGQSRSPIGQTR